MVLLTGLTVASKRIFGLRYLAFSSCWSLLGYKVYFGKTSVRDLSLFDLATGECSNRGFNINFILSIDLHV